ncbi:gluconokinase [Deltaproteobacteria bacterium]|nr:gluconokinase [Deltaproteobacteria bacterium]
MAFLIDDLLNPESLPDKTKEVSHIQTHISHVLVADYFVYKIKKAVDFGFLDFSTLEKRKHYCEQEIFLNRRLSEGIYLDVVPVFFDGRSHKIGKGRGEIVEYAVKMKRIPEDMLMKSIFERGRLLKEHLRVIARILSGFHQTAQSSADIDKCGNPEMFKINTDENFHQTKNYIGITIKQKDFEALKKWTDNFYSENRDLFLERIRSGKIRDCHGDLHMEHICLTEPVSIFDCIEFNTRFRYTDTLADIAFLLMDLEYGGGKYFSDILWHYYNDISGEGDRDAMLTFYKVYRAYVRGKVNSFQIDDERIAPDKKEEAIETAKKYFQLAVNYIS